MQNLIEWDWADENRLEKCERKRHVKILKRLDSMGPKLPVSIKTNETLPDVSFLRSVQCSAENLAVICFTFMSLCLKHHRSLCAGRRVDCVSSYFHAFLEPWNGFTVRQYWTHWISYCSILLFSFSLPAPLCSTLHDKCWAGTSHNNLSPSPPLSATITPSIQ